ncbi:MAG TPA: hypothetical protein VGD45_20000 [Steroidobacter sp.]|uniref:hypothetical protein n=1 Tax=Steroidobacter sp. TaxID=1978227 RepID=UPI002ED8CB00
MYRPSHWSRTALVAALLSCSFTASAWDGVNDGVPGLIEVTNANNYGVRVHLANPVSMCGPNSHSFVYFEPTDDNYKSYMATILVAKAQGTQVRLFALADGNGYCKLGHLAMF